MALSLRNFNPLVFNYYIMTQTYVIILNTISKRQDGSDLFRILHTKSFSKFTEASVYYVTAFCVFWSHDTTSPFLA